MKNVLNTEKNLKLYDDNGVVRYYYITKHGISWEYTYDENNNLLTYRHSDGYYTEYTYDENGVRNKLEENFNTN